MPRDTANKRLRATMVDRSRSPRGREKGKDKTNARLLAAIAEEEKLDADDVAFRQTISDIYLRNKLSAKDTADLVRSANRSSCVGVGDLAKAGGGGKHPKNYQRDLTRALVRTSVTPTPYYAEIPLKDRKSGKPVTAWLPFLLVHEMLFSMVQNAGDLIYDIVSFPENSSFAEIQNTFFKDWGLPKGAVLFSLGFHGDGVPFQAKKSLECFSWNIASVPNGARQLFCCVEKIDLCTCGCFGRHTIDAILAVLVYCMKALLRGKWPSHRHDGAAWRKEDGPRSKRAGSDFGFHAHLCQNWGDWVWFKQVFSFKGWASEQICWRCEANKSDKPYWDVSPGAAWRKCRLTTSMLMAALRREGVKLSPLFFVPGFIADFICIDVLHALDLGVTQEVIGNVLFECLGVFAVGRNRVDQVASLFLKLQSHYKRCGTRNRISNLTVEMIKQADKRPKLRAKGAETRHLLPFALEVAAAMYANDSSTHFLTMYKCVTALMDYYMTFGVVPFPVAAAKAATQNFCSLYRALHDEARRAGAVTWNIKPKLHMFQELGEYQIDVLGDPSGFWTYKDEDFVGLCATIGASRGGGSTATTTPERVIARIRALSG